jgi:hypothetical protein
VTTQLQERACECTQLTCVVLRCVWLGRSGQLVQREETAVMFIVNVSTQRGFYHTSMRVWQVQQL